MSKIKVGVAGYGVIGQRLADGVARQGDMELVGVADLAPTLSIRALKEQGMPYDLYLVDGLRISGHIDCVEFVGTDYNDEVIFVSIYVLLCRVICPCLYYNIVSENKQYQFRMSHKCDIILSVAGSEANS